MTFRERNGGRRPVVFGVGGNGDKLLDVLHGVKELVLIVLVTGVSLP